VSPLAPTAAPGHAEKASVELLGAELLGPFCPHMAQRHDFGMHLECQFPRGNQDESANVFLLSPGDSKSGVVIILNLLRKRRSRKPGAADLVTQGEAPLPCQEQPKE